MFISRLRKTFAGSAVFVATAFGAVGSAQAAVYHGVFDPSFGGVFSGLDWSGSILFDVPDACLASASANATIGCPGAVLQSATVTFAGLDTETLDFSGHLAGAIQGITFDSSSEVSGINTSFIGSVKSTSLLPANEFFNLLFIGSTVALSYMPGANDSPGCYLVSPGCGISLTLPGHGMTVSLVPEPSTYALLLAGLGVVGFVARRRRG